MTEKRKTKKLIKVNLDKLSKNYFFYLKQFSSLIDVDSVHSYEMKTNELGEINLKFYDKKNKVISPKRGF